MNRSFVIFADKITTIAVVDAGRSQFLPEIRVPLEPGQRWAKAIGEILSANSYDGSGVALLLPSSWCLAASIPSGDLPKRNRRALMIYRLEEHFPVAAEDLVIDFSITQSTGTAGLPSASQALGVAALLEHVRPLIEELEKFGVYVQSISAAALFATQKLVCELPQKAPNADVVLWADESSEVSGQHDIEVVELRSGQISGWTTCPDIGSVVRELRHIHLTRALQLQVIAKDLHELEMGALALLEVIEILPSERTQADGTSDLSAEDTLLAAAAVYAASVLAGEHRAAIEFRRDLLAPPRPLRRIQTPLTYLTAALVLFFVTLAGTMLLLARAYDGRTQTCQELEAGLYREAMDKPGPGGSNVTWQFEREDRRLQALSGSFDTSVQPPRGGPALAALQRPRSALMMLKDVLSALPQDLRFRILEMQLSPEQVQLDGQARTHSDADSIADGLRAVGGYIVDPPHSEVHGNMPGVSFTVIAKPVQTQAVEQRVAGGGQP